MTSVSYRPANRSVEALRAESLREIRARLEVALSDLKRLQGYDSPYHIRGGQLMYSIGIEPTYVATDVYPTDTDITDNHGDVRNAILNNEYRRTEDNITFLNTYFPHLKAHKDGGCVEFSSPVYSHLDALMSYFESVNMARLTRPLAPQHCFDFNGEKYQLGSGGCHMHVGFPQDFKGKQLELFKHNMFIFAHNHPFMLFLFRRYFINHYDLWNRRNCCVKGHKNIRRYVKDAIKCGTRYQPIAVRANVPTAWKGGYDTSEFRCFETPEDTQGLILILNFATLCTSYIQRVTERRIELQCSDRIYRFRNKRMTTKIVYPEIQNMFDKISLDFTGYRKFLVNIRERIEYNPVFFG